MKDEALEEKMESGETDGQPMFRCSMSLADLKADKSIFEDGGEWRQAKESAFLKTSVARQLEPAKHEISDVVLRAGANLHKFSGEWENIGMGTVYVTEKEQRRCFFVRDGVMLTAFDFLVKYDVRPTRKRLSVCIVVREVGGEGVVEQLYCLVFRDAQAADEFVRLVVAE